MPSPSKYKNRKSGGYDSKREEKRAWELELLEKAGQIRNLKTQQRFQLLPAQKDERPVHYVADFVYWEGDKEIVEDVKSPMTRKLPAYILKRKMMLFFYDIKIREV